MRWKVLALCTPGFFVAYSWLVPQFATAGPAEEAQQRLLARERAALSRLKPIEGRAVRFAVSPPVSSLRPPLVPEGGVDGGRVRENEYDDFDDKNVFEPLLKDAKLRQTQGVDPALQLEPGPEALTMPLVNFEGISQIDNFNAGVPRVLPPDTVGDVGPRHYVEAVNLVYQVFDKTGAPLTAPFSEAALFASLGGICATTNNGDPIVVYDHLADRWILTHFALFSTTVPPFHQCIAVSQTGDPTGSYFLYDFVMPNNKFNDYPKIAVWTDAYYMTDRQFSPGFTGMGAFAFNRAKILAGDPTANFVYFDVDALTAFLHGMMPADLDGPPPPAGTPGYFLVSSADDQGFPVDSLRLFEFHVDFDNPGASIFMERADSPVTGLLGFDPTLNECFGSVAPFACVNPGGCTIGGAGNFTGRDDIPQPQLSPPLSTINCVRLDAIADRLMHRLVYRNFGTHDTLLAVQTVDALATPPTQQSGHRGAPRYWELRRTPGGPFTVVDQGTFAPDSNDPNGPHRFMPAVAMDGAGNIAVGYSVSSVATFPGVRYTGRLATDPPGTLQAETTLVNGAGIQTSTSSRWGDYSAMSIDPSDDCTFWYTQEYYIASGVAGGPELCPDVVITACWHTRIGSFRFPPGECNPAAQGRLQGSVRNAVTLGPIPNARVQMVDSTTGATYETSTNGLGSYVRDVLPAGTYNVTASATNYVTSTPIVVTMTAGATITRAFTLTPLPALVLDSVAVNDSVLGNSNGGIDPSECVNLNLGLRNTGAATATGVSATLESNTPGVTVSGSPISYPNMAPGTTATNASSIELSIASTFPCGTLVRLTLAVTTGAGTFNIPVTVHTRSAPPPFTATGPLAIPDGNSPGPALLSIPVSGLVGSLSKVTASVHLTHTFDADIDMFLVGPDGTTVELSTDNGGSGDNYGTDCPTTDGDDTTFDDAAAVSITAVSAPLVGTFRPEGMLSAFNGKTGSQINGNWVLRVHDDFTVDVGAIQCASLTITTTGCPSGGGVCANSAPQLAVQSTTVSGGNGDSDVDVDECFDLGVNLANTGTAAATSVSATLTTTTPGVVIESGMSGYADIPAGGSQGNSMAFRLTTLPSYLCGTPIQLSLEVTTAEGTFTVPFQLPTGAPGTPQSFLTLDAAAPIPDGDLAGAGQNISVMGIDGIVSKVTVNAHVTHDFDADLVLRLISPDGTRVYLSSGNGGSGDNYGTDCPADGNDTTFDDAAATSVTAGIAPFVGTFRPETPLSALNGKSGAAVNGTWRLEVADEFPVGVGTLQCWTLNVTARTCDDGGGACPATPTPTPTATATPDPTATGTPTSIISVQDVSQLEGSGGGFSTFRFRVSMFPARSLDTMVEYTTINGTAMQPGDYTDTSGTLVIPAQTPFADINVPVVRDNTFESNEFFRVRLSNPAAGGIVGGDGFGTILNDDPSPTRTPTRTRTPTALRQVPGAGEVGAPSGGETLPTTERNGVLLLAVLALLGSSLALRRRPRRNR